MSTPYYKIESRVTTCTIPKGQTQVGVKVDFKCTFGFKPVVVCSLEDAGPSSTTAFVTCMAWSITKTGFQAFVKFNRGVDPMTHDVTVNMNWIAMEPWPNP